MLRASELPLRQGAGGTLYRLTAVPSAMGPYGGRPGPSDLKIQALKR